ncbi:MAG: adenylate/guanylate cyclase domain-containing protein [Cyclobacteriaceae bacterium]|nr:adenylate/guanylate cyclase domain-containing protein [Cyclobacteriaceae bacterium]
MKGFSEQRSVNYIISAFIVAITISMYFQMEKLVGKNMLFNYLKGRYRKPKKEIRIFLFMDLKSSTSISEKLGNDTYYAFLNDAIYEMSEAIITSGAEIYQYVGDEIVFTWTMDRGIRNNSCLQLFEEIAKRLEYKKAYFMKHYGYIPEFKAAMHAGLVLAAEIGHIRKEIVYSGDVLNTTARMESLCNPLNAKLLVSRSLFNLLDKKRDILYEELGPVELKGKDETIELLKIHFAGNNPDQKLEEPVKARNSN